MSKLCWIVSRCTEGEDPVVLGVVASTMAAMYLEDCDRIDLRKAYKAAGTPPEAVDEDVTYTHAEAWLYD